MHNVRDSFAVAAYLTRLVINAYLLSTDFAGMLAWSVTTDNMRNTRNNNFLLAERLTLPGCVSLRKE